MAKDNRRWAARLARWRSWIQGLFLLAWVGPMGLRLHTVCSPVFHCHSCPWASFACPIGMLAQFSILHWGAYIAVGTLLAVGALFGSFVCGWACPFGFLQDLLHKLPTPKFRLPAWTGYFRYVVLIVCVLLIPRLFGEEHWLYFCRLCPASAMESAVPYAIQASMSGEGGIVWPSAVKLTILGVFFATVLFTWRPWCTVFCPLGAIYSLCNRFSMFFLRFRDELCIECTHCRSLCQDGSLAESRLDTSRCVRCLECGNCRSITLGTAFDRKDEG